MTSSIRKTDKWDFSKHSFKDFDVFCEPGLVSILFLSCGKHKLAKPCLVSTFVATKQYEGELEWILLEQGEGDDREFNLCMFNEMDVERKVVVGPNRNYGINNGLNQMISISRGEFVMIHENDWFNTNTSFNFMKHAVDILLEKNDVGIVRLRDINDPFENWGAGKPEYDPFSCGLGQREYGIWAEKTKAGHEYLISDFPNGYNHNPCLIRKELLRECGFLNEPPLGTDPRHDETHYQKRVRATGAVTAHVVTPVYRHVGGALRPSFEK